MNIYFVRHAESQKSVERRHGGPGLPLTLQGRHDAVELGRFLRDVECLSMNGCRLYGSARIQVVETCSLLGKHLNLRVELCDELRNIHLGVLDGLSDEEAAIQFPDVAIALSKWRAGQQSVGSVEIPGAETMGEFYERIFGFVQRIKQQAVDIIVVGTRSVGVALTNCLLSGSRELDVQTYERYLFDPCSASRVQVQGSMVNVLYINRTDFLSNPPQYPDS